MDPKEINLLKFDLNGSEEDDFSPEEKHRIEEYRRMQNLLNDYGMLGIKFLSAISAGGLVSIGAAYVRIVIYRGNISADFIDPALDKLTTAFICFSSTLLLIFLGLVATYFSRRTFLNHVDGNTDGNKRAFSSRLDVGQWIEGLAIFLIIISAIPFFWALFSIGLSMRSWI